MISPEEMRALCEAATEGPWYHHKPSGDILSEHEECMGQSVATSSGVDCDFIAAARSWVPWAIEEITRIAIELHGMDNASLRAENAKLVALVREAADCPEGCGWCFEFVHKLDCPAIAFIGDVK